MTKFFKLQEGWLTVGLLAMLVFSVTLSIQQADWSDGLSILTPITIVGLVTGIALAKARGVPRILLDLLGLEIGLITVLLAVASVMHDPRLMTVQDRVQDLIARTSTWVNVAVRQDVSDDLVVFVLSLGVVSWVLAYSSAYFVFRSRQLWWALVPNGVALLINLSYSSSGRLNGYIVVFMLSALLLMIRFNLLIKEERWQRERVNYSPTLTWAFLWTGSAVAAVLALAMWYVPASAANSTLNSAWERVNQPWVDLQTTMGKLWSSVPGGTGVGGYASFNKQFTMGGSLNLADTVVLKVQSNEPLKLRAVTWDQYTGTGWNDTAPDTFNVPNLSSRLALDANQQLVSQDEERREVTYTVQVVTPKGDTIFAPLRPVKLSIPSRLNLSWRKLNEVYNIDNFYSEKGAVDIKTVPLELRTLIGLLHEGQQELRQTTPTAGEEPLDRLFATLKGEEIRKQLDELGKRGINATVAVSDGPAYYIELRASGEVPVYDDITGLHATDRLQSGQEYSAVSKLSAASEDELRAAGMDYDEWLKKRYLDLPATVSRQVRDLATQIVSEAGADNPYDAALAIQNYLRQNYEYSLTLPNPPVGVDRTDWFLFDIKKGYCEYYATSMIVMLRSQGIPARFAAGYAPGAYDPATKLRIVKESAAHAWPEVYFPGYGWVDFEPTPSQPVAGREIAAPEPAVSPTPQTTAGATATVSLPQPQKGVDDPGQKLPDNGGDQFILPFGGTTGNLLMLGLLLAATLAGVWLFTRGRRQPQSPGTYYGKMISWARLLRLGPSAHQTPYEFSEALARELPGTGLFARTISRAYVRERYSPKASGPTDKLAVHQAWNALHRKLWRSMPARQLRRVMRKK